MSRRRAVATIVALSLLATIVALSLLIVPAAAARTVTLHDGSLVTIAGSKLTCAVDWTHGVANVGCVVLADPTGDPARGALGIDVNVQWAAATRFTGSSPTPKRLALRRQPPTVPRNNPAHKGSGAAHVVMKKGDIATVAGAPMVIYVEQSPKTGPFVIVVPLSNAGTAIVGSFGAVLSAARAGLEQLTSSAGASKMVYKSP